MQQMLVTYRIRVWGKDAEDSFLNYCEMRKVVEALKDTEGRAISRMLKCSSAPTTQWLNLTSTKGHHPTQFCMSLFSTLRSKLEMQTGC
jgi:hypothetical protein